VGKSLFKLRKKYLFSGGIGFLLFAVFFLFLSFSHDQINLKRVGERENIILAGFLSNLLERQLHEYSSLSITSPESLRHSGLHKQLEDLILQIKFKYHSILKVKIFSLEGLTLYSSDHSEIGISKQNNKPIFDARSGTATSNMVFKKEFMSLNGKLVNRDIVETYIPIYFNNEIIAIFELYSDVTEEVRESNDQLLIMLIIFFSGVLGLFIYLFILARKADDIIKDQYFKLEQANYNLETKVNERTNDLKLALSEAQKANESKSTFLANMSHELRTPMHGILSFTDLALKRVNDEKTARFLNNIKTSGIRLTGLLNALLDLAKLESGQLDIEFHQASLSQITKECITELHSLCEDKSIQIQFDETNELTGVFDSKLIHQVIINLLSNAIKYNPIGGEIRVNISSVGKDEDEIFTGVLELSVSDEGPGIPEDELNTVFDKFVQSSKTDSKAGGTGLGLSICKEIINAHKGLIWAESPVTNDGVGSCFHFILPMKQDQND
jgi:signal transduction histidine kinase